MPRLENLRQNSTDWHDWRRGGLGSSDAPVVMGNSPWMTPRKLWSIKTHRIDEADPDNIATAAGVNSKRRRGRLTKRETAEIMEPHCVSQ